MPPLPPQENPSLPIPQGAPRLVYEPPLLGGNYWILDNALPNAQEVVQRCLRNDRWVLGYPHGQQSWPGMRFHGALTRQEVAGLEEWVRKVTGARSLWVETAEGGARLDFNVAQLVGFDESGPRPHTDRRDLCTYAAVLYLNPQPASGTGTSFYRLRYANGALGGNCVGAPHVNLLDALQVPGLPAQAWQEVLQVDNVFNRLLLYKASLVHSATGYCGHTPHDKRLTAVFFWMAA